MTKDYMLSRKVGPNVPRDRWVASLSNGETIYEDETKGERPSWERLSEYCVDNDLSITNLRLNIVIKKAIFRKKSPGHLAVSSAASANVSAMQKKALL
jgi:hypothetical protein